MRGAVVSVDPVTATLPVLPGNVQSGEPPFCGAVVGHEPAAVAVPDKTSVGTTAATQAARTAEEYNREDFTALRYSRVKGPLHTHTTNRGICRIVRVLAGAELCSPRAGHETPGLDAVRNTSPAPRRFCLAANADPRTQTPPSALTPAVQRLPVACGEAAHPAENPRCTPHDRLHGAVRAAHRGPTARSGH